MILLIIKVCFISFIMKCAADFCLFRAKTTRNQNIRFVWLLIAILIVVIAIMLAAILLWSFIMSAIN